MLATVTHLAPPQDLTAWALLDADLAILGADPGTYDRYRAAVREEYAALDDGLAGRARGGHGEAAGPRPPLRDRRRAPAMGGRGQGQHRPRAGITHGGRRPRAGDAAR